MMGKNKKTVISTGTATYRIATSIFALSVDFLIFTLNPVAIKKKTGEIIKRFEAVKYQINN